MEVTLVFETRIGGALRERVEERSLVGLIDREGVHRVLAETGFSVSREFSDYRFTPFQGSSTLLVGEACRAG